MKVKEYKYIATLGFAPQVVTLGLFSISKRYPDHAIDEVIVVHTSQEVAQNAQSIQKLKEVFEKDEALNSYELKFAEIQSDGKPIADIKTPEEVEATLSFLFDLMRDIKLKDYNIHLNVSGGRKTMSILAIIAAQMLFDEDDYAWHIISEPDVMNSRSMVMEDADKVQLIDIPVIPWSDTELQAKLPPHFDSEAILSGKLHRMLYRDRRKRALKGFVSELTDTERAVLRELVVRGGSNREIAKRLGKSPRTVEHQIQTIYRKFKAEFGIPNDVKLRRELLVKEFSDIF